MGIFNTVLKGLGFEGEKKEQQEVKEDKTPTYNTIGAEYDLTKVESKVEKKEPQTIVPQNQQEVQQIVDTLKLGETVIVNLEQFKNTEYVRALDFMSGATYVLDGKIKKIGDKTYMFCPKLK